MISEKKRYFAHLHFPSDDVAKSQANRAAEHPVWGGPGWKVFLSSREDMQRTVNYIENNPVKIGRPIQQWDFVRPYDRWMPGQVRIVKKRKRAEQQRY